MSESSGLQTSCIRWLKSKGGEWEVRSPSPFSPSGVPDIVGCYHGCYVAIELKKPGKSSTLQADQRRALYRINKNGGYAFSAESLKQVKHFMRFVDSTLNGA